MFKIEFSKTLKNDENSLKAFSTLTFEIATFNGREISFLSPALIDIPSLEMFLN